MFKTVRGARIASPFNFEVELKDIILVVLWDFEFSHGLDQQRKSAGADLPARRLKQRIAHGSRIGPAGDLALLRKLGLRHPQELERRAEAWRPWRAYAAVYLWSDASEAHKKKPAAVEAGAGVLLKDPQSRPRANDAPEDLQFAD